MPPEESSIKSWESQKKIAWIGILAILEKWSIPPDGIVSG